jgi:hypothetical protein
MAEYACRRTLRVPQFKAMLSLVLRLSLHFGEKLQIPLVDNLRSLLDLLHSPPM